LDSLKRDDAAIQADGETRESCASALARISHAARMHEGEMRRRPWAERRLFTFTVGVPSEGFA
jgi:hypothetical protein